MAYYKDEPRSRSFLRGFTALSSLQKDRINRNRGRAMSAALRKSVFLGRNSTVFPLRPLVDAGFQRHIFEDDFRRAEIDESTMLLALCGDPPRIVTGRRIVDRSCASTSVSSPFAEVRRLGSPSHVSFAPRGIPSAAVHGPARPTNSRGSHTVSKKRLSATFRSSITAPWRPLG